MTATFDTWLTKQFAEGLVDIKFAVLPGKGVSVEAVQDELMAAEALLATGLTKQAPLATSMIPDNIAEVIRMTVH